MARRKKQTRRPPRPHHDQEGARAFRAGVLVVHGVGNQRRGSTAKLAARRTVAALVEVGEDAEYAELPATADEPRAYRVSMPGQRPILVAECHWSSIILKTRGRGARDVLRRLWLVVVVLPFLLGAVIFPRVHEGAAIETITISTETKFGSVRGLLKSARALAPTIWRMATLIGVVFLVGVGLAQLTIEVLIAVLAGAGVVLGVLLQWRWDVIEHVRVASLGAHARDLIEERLARDIDHVVERCDEVWIIGHSQGGYLAHRVLAQRGRGRWLNVKKFTGLASGIRPIRLIASVHENGWARSGWLVLAGMVIMMVAMAWGYEPGGVINTEGARIFSLVVLLGLIQPLGMLWASPMSGAILEKIWPTQWVMLPILALGIVVFFIGVVASRRARQHTSSIPAIPSRIIWEELTSPSDVVGSMSIPEIPAAALCRSIPSLRQPVGDHLMASYLSRRSIFRMEMARWVARTTTAAPKFRHLDEVAEDLAQLSERAYRVRLAVQGACVLMFVLLPAAIFGRSLVLSATSFVLWGVGIAGGVASITGLWWLVGARRRMARFVRSVANTERYRRHTWITRPTWSVATSAVCAFTAALGAYGTYVYASLLTGSFASSAAEENVRDSVTGSGGSLMVAALFALVAVWLAIARVSGVRPILAVALLFIGQAFATLSATGDLWFLLGMPGIFVPFVTGAGLLTAILGSRRIEAGVSTLP